MQTEPSDDRAGQSALSIRTSADENFQRIFNLSPCRMGIFRAKDGVGVILAVNESWVQETGYTREETVGHSMFEFLLSDQLFRSVKQMLRDGKPVRDVEGRVKTKRGEERFVVSSTAIVEFEGEPCFLWATNDITERKRAEDALRRNEELFRAIVRDQSEMIVRWQPDGTRTFVNRAYCDVFGGEPEDFIGTSFLPLVAENYRGNIRKKVQSLTPENPLATEIHESLGDGEMRWQEWTDRGLFDEAGRLIELQSTGRDITERKRSEDALRASSEQLRALSARLRAAREEEGTRIAREIHDELGAALTGLKWDMERVEKTLLPSVNGEAMNLAREKISSMTGLIDSTIEAVRRIASELRPSVLDDLGLATAIEWQAEQFQQRTGMIVKCDCGEELSVGREQALTVFRIFQEILTNVLRHSQATQVLVQIRSDNETLVLEVRDNGRGITDEQKTGSHSLGLLGMRERAHLVGGAVRISGAEGKGTTVTVTVPLK